MSLFIILGLVVLWLICARRSTAWMITADKRYPSDGEILSAYILSLIVVWMAGPILLLCDAVRLLAKGKNGRETALRIALGKRRLQHIEKHGWRG